MISLGSLFTPLRFDLARQIWLHTFVYPRTISLHLDAKKGEKIGPLVDTAVEQKKSTLFNK